MIDLIKDYEKEYKYQILIPLKVSDRMFLHALIDLMLLDTNDSNVWERDVAPW